MNYGTPSQDHVDAVRLLQARFANDQAGRNMMTRAINSLTFRHGNGDAGALVLIEKLADCDRSDLKFFDSTRAAEVYRSF